MSIAKKVSNVQKAVGTLKKGTVNPFYNSSYIDINGVLEVLQPILDKEGLVVMQPLSHVGERPAIETILADVDTGESLQTTAVIPEIGDPQKAGGAITYFRRYSLISLFGLGAEDDDANAASNKTTTKKASSGSKGRASRSF